jgi:hypothetical protein
MRPRHPDAVAGGPDRKRPRDVAPPWSSEVVGDRLQRLVASPWTWTLVAALLFALKAIDVWLAPQLWGEDGPLFLVGALTDPLGSIVEPYAGYLHLLPRLLALSARVVPLAWVPAAYAGLAFLATVCVMAYVATAPMPVRHWQVSPLALAIVPHSGEVMFTITNLQWIAATCLALAAASPPAHSRARRGLDLIVVALLGLSGPFSMMFLPGFVLRAWFSRRDPQAWALLVVAATTAAVQLAFIASDAPLGLTSPDWPGWSAVAHVIVANGFGQWFAFDQPLMPWGIVVAVGVAVALAGPLFRSRTRQAIVTLWLCAAITLGAAILKFSTDVPTMLTLAPYGNGARYFYPPAVFIAWMLWMAAWDRARVSGCAAVLALALFVANGVWHAKGIDRPDQNWAEQVRRFEAGEITALRILPLGWTVSLPRSSTTTAPGR